MAFLLVLPFLLHAQDPVTLQFTGQDQHGQFVPLSTVYVENLTKRWQEVLYYPDTTLNIGVTGVEEFGRDSKSVRLFQNVPNPFDGVTDFALQLPEPSDVLLEIYDLNGKVTATYQSSLDPGCHQFRAWLAAPQTYLLNARTENGAVRIKMVNTGRAGQSRIEYIGKGASLRAENPKNGSKGDITMPFNYGDTMLYKGYAHLADSDFTSTPVVKAQYSSELIPLTFVLPLPTVTTEDASNITSTTAWLNGSVIENAEYLVTERGFLLADNEQLTDVVQLIANVDDESFHYEAHDLQIASRYYYRAYAQTALGITYGDILFFDTQSEPPVVQTFAVDNITSNSATCGGEVTADGGANVTSRGICWSTTSQNPTINDNCTTEGTGIGIFSSNLIGLLPNTTYYLCAYATNSMGTAYGQQTSFTTLANLPEVSTGSVTNITSSSATCGGNVISNGGDIITARGICWSSSQNPTLNDSHTEEGTGTGYFSSNITGLTTGTTYYVRAYATNSAGTAYGQETSFTALALPTVSTSTVTDITASTAICGGHVTGTGGSNVTARGVCWSTSQNPTINNGRTVDGNDIGSFTSYIVGLASNTTYYVRAYATNSVGTAYGEEVFFTTEEIEIIVPIGDAQPCPSTPTVTDHEGNIYNTVKIGNQCWTKENLRTTTSPSTGTYLIPDTNAGLTFTGKQARWYNNDSTTYAPQNYGLLYNWNAAVDTFNTAYGETSVDTSYNNGASVTFNGHCRGICPVGWHLPSYAEWTQLMDYVSSQNEYTCGGESNYIAKALASTEGWVSSGGVCSPGNQNVTPNNATGFSAIPTGGGGIDFEEFFSAAGDLAFFWLSKQSSSDNAYNGYLDSIEAYVARFPYPKYYECSVRCLRD